MANQKISARDAATAIDGTEVVGVIKGGVDKKTTVAELQPFTILVGYLNQSGTSAPVLTILSNTTGGAPTLAYSSAGTYTLTLTGKFIAGKTFILPKRQVMATDIECIFTRQTADTLLIQTFTTSTATLGNSLLSDTPIEIRIYK